MIIIIPEKSMVKKGEKYVRPKDFIIADATQDSGSEVSSMGQRVRADEFGPTPTLMKIALDPDSAEARIKKRNINKYLEHWLDDTGVTMKLNYLMTAIVDNWKLHGEDMNVFIVLQKVAYREYATYIKEHIESLYGKGTATLLTHKMAKDVVKEILGRKYPKDMFEEIRRRSKQITKDMEREGIKTEDYLNLEDD